MLQENSKYHLCKNYVGAATGGAVGGVTTLYAGPVVGAMAEGAVSTLSAEGLKAITDPNYNKDVKEVFLEAAENAAIGTMYFCV